MVGPHTAFRCVLCRACERKAGVRPRLSAKGVHRHSRLRSSECGSGTNNNNNNKKGTLSRPGRTRIRFPILRKVSKMQHGGNTTRASGNHPWRRWWWFAWLLQCLGVAAALLYTLSDVRPGCSVTCHRELLLRGEGLDVLSVGGELRSREEGRWFLLPAADNNSNNPVVNCHKVAVQNTASSPLRSQRFSDF